MLAKAIADSILKTAYSENLLLSRIADEGIFHMPELAFAYECGKQIMINSEEIFGNNSATWIREKDLGNGGPTDLLFELSSGQNVAIEFKLRDTANSYKKDVEKLAKLDGNTMKLFCALIDVFDSKLPDDGRQHSIESLYEHEVRPILKKSFSTKQNWYSSPVYCVVCIWSVGIVPEIDS